MYTVFFKSIQKVMCLVVLFWLWVACEQLLKLPWIGLFLLGSGILLWVFQKEFVKSCYAKVMQHKMWLVLAVIGFQIAVILSANLLVRRDAAVVITGAFHMIEDQYISNYLTRNPNNLPMFLYARYLYHIFGEQTIWVLQALGILYINGTAYVLYRTGKEFFNQQVADALFCLYLLLLGFSPYVIQTYTDITALPFLAIQLYLMIGLLKEDKKQVQRFIGLGLVTALALVFRPTAAVIMIALAMVWFFRGNWSALLRYFLICGCSFGLLYGGLTYLMAHQQEVRIVQKEELAKGLTTFINLGLTYSGTDQEDMKEGLLAYIDPDKRDDYNNGMFAQKNEVKEIKRRLAAYTLYTFLDHLRYKLSETLYDGALNWLYLGPDKEKTPLVSPLYENTKENAVTEAIRQTIIQYDGQYYPYYQAIKQLVWLLMIIGLLLALSRYQADDSINFLSLAIFGGILFLMIFEGGKTRYLLQFFPQILLLSSLGLTQYCQKERKRKT